MATVALVALTTLVTITLPVQVAAATSNTLNFQARLETASGAITPDGTYNVEFKLYNASSSSGSSQGSCTGDANCLWVETRTSANRVRVVNGYLTVNLGSVTALPSINWSQQLWLTMNIGGTGASPVWDGEMNPKIQLTAVPYAFTANQLGATSGSNVATLSFGTISANDSIALPDASGTVCLQNATACGFAPSTGGTGYVNLQATTPGAAQTGNFNISGTGIAGLLQAGGLTITNAGNIAFQKGADFSTIGTSNNVNFGTGTVIRLTGASAQTITGISGGVDGKVLAIVNAAVQVATLSNQNGGSSATNQIVTGSGSDLSLPAGGAVYLVYDAGSNVWRVVGSAGGGGSFVQLQATSPGIQQTGGFNISGTGIAGILQAGSLDTAAAGALTIGNTNATAINLGNTTNNIQTTINGTALVKPTSGHDSTTAFQVQTAGGINLLTVDSVNHIITTGQSNLIISDIAVPGSLSVGVGSNQGGSLTGTVSTVYYYEVTATNSLGESLPSSESSIAASSFTPLTAPGAPSLALAAGTNLGTGAYKYKITFTSANGETTGSTEATITTTTGNQAVSLTAIPTGPTGTVARKIYRTVVGGASGAEKLVTTLNNNTTTTYTDTTADGSLGANLPASNTATTNSNNTSLTWTSVTGATGYRIYRGTASGGENAYQTSATNSFTDTGAAGTAATPPTHSSIDSVGIGTSSPTANLTVAGTGLFKNIVNSTTAFQVQTAGGNALLNVDTANATVSVKQPSGGQIILSATAPGTAINDPMTSSVSGTLLGTATWVSGQYVQENNNSSQSGAVEYTPTLTDFDATFQFNTTGGADAQYIYAFCNSTPSNHVGAFGGYIAAYNQFNSVVQLYYNGAQLASVAQSGFNNGAWHNAEFIKSGTNFKVYLDGSLMINYTDVLRSLTGSKFGLGGWSGGINGVHEVSNLVVSSGTSNIVLNGNIAVTGNTTQTGNVTQTGQLYVSPTLATQVVATFAGAASQSGDLVDLTNNSASVLAHFDSTANLYVPSIDTQSSAALNIGGTNATSIGIGKTTNNIATTINGTTVIKPTTGHDSTTAFQVQGAGGSTLLNMDSVNNQATLNSGLRVNTTAPSGCSYANFVSAITGLTPTAYWKLEDTSGTTAVDSSGNSDTGTISATGVTLNQTPGPFSCATSHPYMAFNASNSGKISTATSFTNPTVLSLVAIFKTTGVGTLLSLDGSGIWGNVLYIGSDGKLYGGINTGSGLQTVVSSAAVNNGSWHEAALTYSSASGGASLYLDGALVAQNTSITGQASFTGKWDIGWQAGTAWPNQSAVYFTGNIAQVAVVPTVLSGSQAVNLAGYAGLSTVSSGVGIGLSGTPSYLLDVGGDINSSTAVRTPSLDTAGASQLTLGSGNATAISLGNTTSNIQTTLNGTALVKPTSGHDSTTAFQVQNAGSAAILTIDTTNGQAIINGNVVVNVASGYSGNLAVYEVNGSTQFAISAAGHLISSGSAPTAGTISNCGTSPSLAIASGSTDARGMVTLTTGSGAPTASCTGVVTFANTYGSAPFVVVSSDSAQVAVPIVSATATGSFTIGFNGSAPLASTAYAISYVVMQ